MRGWRFVLLLVSLLGVAAPALAKTLEIPPLTGRVVDQAAILDQRQESDLTARLAELERKTTIQLVVVTLKSLQGRPIEEWGITLGRGWGIGQAGKNNGVLLIVAPSERKLRIEVGYGLEGTLPDATADAIVRQVIVPRFKAGNMYGGISDGVEAIGRALTGEKLTFAQQQTLSQYNQSRKKETPAVPVAIFALIVFLILVASLRDNRRSRRRGEDDDDEDDSGWTWSSGSDSGGSWSSGRSSGGGFSGGGGSFGGGGASGKW